MSTISLSFNLPFDIGDYVYKKADLETLQEHSAYYSDLIKYRVVGYELNVVENDEGTITSDYDNVIIKIVQIGEDEYDGRNEYVYYGILELETSTLIQKIDDIRNANLL